MLSGVWTMPGLQASRNIGPIMRGAPVIPLQLPVRLVADARLYSGRGHDLDAVCYVLEDYGRLLGELRQLRRRLADLEEQTDFDSRLEALQDACRAILDL